MYRDWLRRGLDKHGKTQQGLADALGIDRTGVTKMLSGKRSIKADELELISAYLGEPVPHKNNSSEIGTGLVDVIGAAAGGVWREAGSSMMFQNIAVSVVPDPKYTGLRQYALRVEGIDFNREFKLGDFLIFVPFWEVRKQPQEGDIVQVERRDAAGRKETTIRRVRIREGKYELWPESSEPMWSKPVVIEDIHNKGEVEIVGLHIGMYRPATT
jgi:transcriptional regulator with XRE-family HTH domain